MSGTVQRLHDRWVGFVQGPDCVVVPPGAAALDVGCGRNKLSSAIGIDKNPETDADVVHDLDRLPYPFDDDSFDVIVARHVLEHLEAPLDVLGELHRVGRQGGEIHIVTPHFSSPTSWTDPTHRHHFSSRSFDYLVAGTVFDFYSERRFVVDDRAVTLGLVQIGRGRVFPMFRVLGIESLVNRYLDVFERWWAFALPLGQKDLHVRLRIVK